VESVTSLLVLDSLPVVLLFDDVGRNLLSASSFFFPHTPFLVRFLAFRHHILKGCGAFFLSDDFLYFNDLVGFCQRVLQTFEDLERRVVLLGA
jgi:hypothetical protein